MTASFIVYMKSLYVVSTNRAAHKMHPTKRLLTWGDEPELSCKRGQNAENISGKEEKGLKELPV